MSAGDTPTAERHRPGPGHRARPAPRIRTIALILPALAAASACHTYEPLQATFPAPGQQVRLHYAGDEDPDGVSAGTIQGRVVSWAADSARLTLPDEPRVDREGRGRQNLPPDTVALASSLMDQIEIRRLNWPRTLAFTAGAGLAAGLLAALLFEWVRDAPESPPETVF